LEFEFFFSFLPSGCEEFFQSNGKTWRGWLAQKETYVFKYLTDLLPCEVKKRPLNLDGRNDELFERPWLQRPTVIRSSTPGQERQRQLLAIPIRPVRRDHKNIKISPK
jgi:hypothetical protein